MRSFACQQCGQLLFFDNTQCLACGSFLGFLPNEREIVVFDQGAGVEFRRRFGDDGQFWRCLNASWGCNWMVATTDGNGWCQSCRLTRKRPADNNVAAVRAWTEVEAAKRVLLFQLGELHLPVLPRGDLTPHGLAFDLIFEPGAVAVTGHRDGVVTIDLTESDGARREQLRQALEEPYRTMLGHLRHEIGHYYWPVLVERTGWIDAFRGLFGDERSDYTEALKRHYGRTAWGGWGEQHVSFYATAHPWEDWAETFAHYIHIRDTLQTARSFGIRMVPPSAKTPPEHERRGPEPRTANEAGFDTILAAWLPLTYALNAVNRSMGHNDLYPFVLAPAVMRKLAFVHDRVLGNGG